MTIALGVIAAGLLVSVVYWFYRVAETRASLGQASAAYQLERERVAKMESAAAEQRETRTQELDAQADSVGSADDAARLLREQFGWGRKPEAP